MTLILQRTHEVNDTTFGKLFTNDMEFLNYTLEDKVRPVKIKHETAIPAGTYEIQITYSPKFKQRMPLLLDVPNYEGIRIHKGNLAIDTSGCIIVGDRILSNKIVYSATAYQRLFTFLENLLKKDKVYIRIEDIPKEIPIIKPIEQPKVELPKETILPEVIIQPVKQVEVITQEPTRFKTKLDSTTHKYNKMDNNKTLVQDLVLANLNVISLEVLPLIEKDYARLAANVGLEKIKQTVLILLDDNTDNKTQLSLIWGKAGVDSTVVEAVKSALLTAVSSVNDDTIKEGLTLLIEPLTQTLTAVSDTVKPDGEQIKQIWLNFIQSPVFMAYILANLETVIKLVIKNDNLEKILLSLLKVFGKL